MRTEIVLNLPDASYRAAEGLSCSELKCLAGGVPGACKAHREQAIEPTEAMIFGRLVHLAILEPDLFGNGISHHERPEGMSFASKEGKAWRDAHSDLPILGGDRYSAASITGMRDSLMAMPEAAAVLNWKGDTEVSMFAGHPGTGLQLKGRCDKLSEDDAGRPTLIDLKTTDDVGQFERTCAGLNYGIQDAYYSRLLEANGMDTPTFLVIAVSTKPPYSVRLGVLDDATRQRSRARVDELLELYALCKEKDHWPAYPVNQNGTRRGVETFTVKFWS